MRKYFAIWVIVSFCIPPVHAQEHQEIDSLKKLLPTLKDTARIECLNEICVQYLLQADKDSTIYYADFVYVESKKIHYIHGLAISFLHQAQIAKHFDDDFAASEALCKESLKWYDQTANKAGLGELYSYIIYALLSQSRFQEGIEYANKRYALAKQTGDLLGMMDALGWMQSLYRTSGDYEKAFYYWQRVYNLALKSQNKFQISGFLYGMAQLYELIGDYPNALVYFRRVLQMDDDEIRNERIATDNDIWFKMELTEAFSHLGQFDSAWHYYSLYKPATDKAVYLRVWWVSSGECLFLQHKYQPALQNFQLGLAEHQRLNDRNEVMRALLDISKTYLALNQNAEALQYGREGLGIALQTKSRQFIRDGYFILSTVYERRHQADSANHYFRQYIAMKEAVLNDQTKGKFAAYNYEQKIALMQKEEQIQEAKLGKAALHRNVLIGGIVGLVILGIFAFRILILKRRNEKQQLQHALDVQKLENEKTKAELQHQASELEMQALRAQMNPHFIFNCLSSINRFILINETEAASSYLIRFSRLVRMVLANSKQTVIPLEDELDMLRLYLDLERMRFKNAFDYSIVFINTIDSGAIFIPPLLLQPFAENAIWHGLMHKRGHGCLKITLADENDCLVCTIMDNGVGRMAAALQNRKSVDIKKSLGLAITAERLALHNGGNGEAPFFSIEDLTDEEGQARGTKVVLKIKYKELAETMGI